MVDEQESREYGTETGDTQVGRGPHEEYGDAGMYTGDAQVVIVPFKGAVAGVMAVLGAS